MQTIPLYGAARPLFADCLVELTSTSFKTFFSHGPSRLILSTKVLNRGARTLACSYESAGKAANTYRHRGARFIHAVHTGTALSAGHFYEDQLR